MTTQEQLRLIGLLILSATQDLLFLKIAVGDRETKYSVAQVGFEKSRIVL